MTPASLPPGPKLPPVLQTLGFILAPVQFIEGRRGWLWVRHQDTLSNHPVTKPRPIDAKLRARFPGVNWEVIADSPVLSRT